MFYLRITLLTEKNPFIRDHAPMAPISPGKPQSRWSARERYIVKTREMDWMKNRCQWIKSRNVYSPQKHFKRITTAGRKCEKGGRIKDGGQDEGRSTEVNRHWNGSNFCAFLRLFLLRFCVT